MSDGGSQSKNILSYWTSERMQSAQPEPDPEFTMSSTESFQGILDYWTPERIAAAQPEELAYAQHIDDEAEEQNFQDAGPLQIVPDDKVKTFPYQSVEKFFYTKVGPGGQWRDSYASAWVANMPNKLHIVYTAAHNLKRGNERAQNIVFIPGFIPPTTKPFGIYPQVPGGEGTAWWVHPGWNPNNMQPKFDLGIVELDKDTNTGKYVDEVVVAIQIISNLQYTSTSEWNTIGFPVSSSQNPYGKMCEQSGTFIKISDGAVYKYGTLPKGTSGGPWILAAFNYVSSNGVQAGNGRDNIGSAVSPYFQSSAEQLAKLFKFES